MERRPAVLGFVAALLMACSSRRPDVYDRREPPQTFSIAVANRNTLDVIVYMVHDGTQTRLGLATAATTTEFSVSLRALGAGGEYRLLGHPVGSRLVVTTESLRAHGDDNVTWSIEDNFARSSVVVH